MRPCIGDPTADDERSHYLHGSRSKLIHCLINGIYIDSIRKDLSWLALLSTINSTPRSLYFIVLVSQHLFFRISPASDPIPKSMATKIYVV